MREFMNITKALADETRVRVLLALSQGELCACQVTELFGLAPSTMSKHLSILHQAGLVAMRKQSRWIYYRLSGEETSGVLRWVLDLTIKALEKDSRVLEDGKSLKKILKLDPSKLCKRQCRN